MLRNSSTHFGIIARLMHWVMALIIISGLTAVELHDLFPKGSDLRNAMMSIHFQAGLMVFALVWLRIGAVAFDQAPYIRPVPPRWQEVSAKLAHLALYAAMIAMPILGVLVQQSGDRAVSLLGMPLPQFIGVDKDFSKVLREVHSTIGNVVIGLILVHAGAAFWHHFRQRDNTLLRMLSPRS